MTNTCEDDFGGWGVTAVDALSTAILMEQDEVVVAILKFISLLDFRHVKQGDKIQTFEISIRTFAAMLSAWDLLHGPFSKLASDPVLRQSLYDQMVVMGDVLSCAFGTPSGIPRDWVDPARCETGDGTKNTIAGAGTMLLEFARLSDITKNDTYRRLAEKAEGYLLNPEPLDMQPYAGLLGSYVSVYDGQLLDAQGSWGAFADCECSQAVACILLTLCSILRVSSQSICVRQQQVQVMVRPLASRSRLHHTAYRFTSVWPSRMELVAIVERQQFTNLSNGVSLLVFWRQLHPRWYGYPQHYSDRVWTVNRRHSRCCLQHVQDRTRRRVRELAARV